MKKLLSFLILFYFGQGIFLPQQQADQNESVYCLREEIKLS